MTRRRSSRRNPKLPTPAQIRAIEKKARRERYWGYFWDIYKEYLNDGGPVKERWAKAMAKELSKRDAKLIAGKVGRQVFGRDWPKQRSWFWRP